MKKIFAVLVFVFVAAGVGFAQADGMLDLRSYTNIFLSNRVMHWKYIDASSDEDFERISALGGDLTDIDTPLEIALLSTCAGVAEIRPAEANRMIGTPRQADLKLGAAVFQEIQILRFLGDTAAVGRHEAVLSFITGRGNVTRQEIEAFYRNNVGELIAGVVDAEFRGVTVPAATVTYVKQSLTNFFTTPNQANFNTIKSINDSTSGNLEYIQQSYDTDITNLRNAEEWGLTNVIEMYRNSARTAQNTLNTARRQINAPNDAPIDWSGFRSGYTRILNGLNTELVRRMR